MLAKFMLVLLGDVCGCSLVLKKKKKNENVDHFIINNNFNLVLHYYLDLVYTNVI